MADGPRRFPAPWHADKIPGGYVVRDDNGQALAYLYSRAIGAAALLSRSTIRIDGLFRPNCIQALLIAISRVDHSLTVSHLGAFSVPVLRSITNIVSLHEVIC